MRIYWLHFKILLLLLLVLSSCNEIFDSKDFTVSNKLLEIASKELNSKPDIVVVITDSVLHISDKNKLDNKILLKALVLRQKAFSRLENMDSVIAVGNKLRIIAERIPDSLAIANSLLLVKGEVDYVEHRQLLKYLPQAIATFDKAKMYYEKGLLLTNYGASLNKKGDYQLAQTMLFKAYKIFDELDSTKALWKVCLNIGNTYHYIDSWKDELVYYKKAYDIAVKRNDSVERAATLVNISGYYNDTQNYGVATQNYDTAIYYITEANKIIPKSFANQNLQMKIDYQMANIFKNKGNYSLAESVFNNLLQSCNKKGAMEGVAMACNGLGAVYAKTNRPLIAIEYIKNALKIADSIGQSTLVLEIYPNLINTYQNMGDYKHALEALMLKTDLNDSLVTLEKDLTVHGLENRYETEKKEQENKLLITELSLNRKIIILLIVISIVLVLLWQVRKKLHKQLEASYDVLMEKYRVEREDKQVQVRLPLSVVANEVVQEVEAETVLVNGLFERLSQYYKEEQPYKNPKLKAEEVVSYLGVSQNDILKVLKANNYPNFNAFTNYYRVEAAKSMFEDAAYDHLKIETIAEMAGFGNKRSFYTAFEGVTGVNPGYYRNSFLKKV